MDRRDALKISGGAAFAALMGAAAEAKARALRVLILGGTGFIGPHFVRALAAGGHTVTLFNRGKRDPEAKHGVEQLLGDRNDDLKSLAGRDWDVVVDNSGYTPKQVRLSAQLLEGHVGQYIFISSIAVYANFDKPPIGEDYALAELPAGVDPNVFAGEHYGALKALCEREVERTYGRRANLMRPTYICGPGDVSDRFTYWPHRVAQGGEMIAPGTEHDPIQYIDVRDLADFVRVCAEKRVGGRYNLVTPPRKVTMGRLLEESRRVTGADTELVWADAEFLLQHKAIEPGMWASQEIPIWAPPQGPSLGHGLVSSTAAQRKGLKYRPLAVTIRETLEWQKARPADKQKLRSGLSAERERELLAMLGR
jgi:2'-hydroxyisoflavone reductase